MDGKKESVSYPKGLEGVVIGESTKSFIDGERGYLAYSGISIEELARKSSYEEVCFLLLNDRLPSEKELEDFKKTLVIYREIPDKVYLIIQETMRYGIHPMTVLRLAVDMLAVFDEETEIDTWSANFRKGIKLISRLHTITAAIGRALKGEQPVRPRDELSAAANWLWMYRGTEPSKEDERIFDIVLILHAEHEMNASTFSARVVVSSLTDIYSAVSAALGSLKGPLHGGANEEVMKMLSQMEDGNVSEIVERKIQRKEKIPGFGHRVYKSYDPRAAILKEIAEKLAQRDERVRKWLEIGKKVEEVILEKLGHKKIYPNVDFYSGIVMSALGIERKMFTPIFATGRIAGWVAHILEQIKNNRIFRPRIIYVGDMNRPYIPIEMRETRETGS